MTYLTASIIIIYYYHFYCNIRGMMSLSNAKYCRACNRLFHSQLRIFFLDARDERYKVDRVEQRLMSIRA